MQIRGAGEPGGGHAGLPLQPGQVIGAYQVIEVIGRGGRTVVYKAYQQTLGRWVTLKVLCKRDPQALEAFRQEAQRTANLGHGGVRQIYEAGQTPDGFPFLVMQYLETSLREVLRAYREQGHTMPPNEVARILAPVADVLDHIHQKGLVHLDIKPENILLSLDGQAVLADFGSARPIGGLTHEGTPAYFSPEQAAGDRPTTPQSDVYSLAVVAYEMLTGQLPFSGEMDIVLARQHLEEPPRPLRQANPALSRELEQVIAAALSKDARQRPTSACAFVEQLRAAKAAATPVKSRRPRRRAAPRWGVLALLGGASLAVVAGAVVSVNVLLGAPTPSPAATPPPPTETPPAFSSPTPALPAATVKTRTPSPTPVQEPTTTLIPTPSRTPTRPPSTPGPSPAPQVSCDIVADLKNGAEVPGGEVSFQWTAPQPASGEYYEVRVDGKLVGGQATYNVSLGKWIVKWNSTPGQHTWEIVRMGSDKRSVVCRAGPWSINVK